MSSLSTNEQIEKLMRILRSKRLKHISIDEDEETSVEDDDEKKDSADISHLMSRMHAGASSFVSSAASIGYDVIEPLLPPPVYPPHIPATGSWPSGVRSRTWSQTFASLGGLRSGS